VYGLDEEVGDVADLNELNLGLQLIDQPVRAYGTASGALEGTIKALFYRHKSLAGYDYVSEFLISPGEGATQTGPGDSGMVWHLRTTARDAHGKATTILRPMAVEWGGQTILGSADRRFNFALATGLSTACQLLDVDLVGVVAQAGAEDQGDLRLKAGPGPNALQARLQFPVYFAHICVSFLFE